MSLSLLRDHDPDAARAARPIFLIREKAKQDIAGAPAELAELAAANAFVGEVGAVLAGKSGALVGIGDGSDPFIIAAAAERLPDGDYALSSELDPAAARAAAFGWLLGGYRFDRYKRQKPPSAALIAPEGVDAHGVRREAQAVFEARDLINTPASEMTPAAIEKAARNLGREFDAQASSIVGADLLTRNFPMIHAVGRAADAAPRLIELSAGRHDAPKVTIVGKGVCFDSGGLDIKNADGMRLMKKDMGGAAAALGLARLVLSSGLDVRLRVLIPAVENAISGQAFRPGDILRSRKGLTVEIGNTDAEGRLILADALALAGEDQPAITIVFATLTGAARVALGPDLPALFCDDDGFSAEIAAAGAAVGDPVWRMPLWAGYEHMLASPVADLNNSPGGAFAGAIAAGLFLKRFAPGAGLFAHFDIYAWRARPAPGRPVGGEAQAMRAVYHALARRFG